MNKTITPDKWKHFIVGMGLGLLLEYLVAQLLPAYLIIGSVIALILIMIISYGFELMSLLTKRGHYDLLDAVAGAAGGIVGIAIIILSLK